MQENFEKEFETQENQVSYVYKNGEYTTPARSFSTLECIFAWLSLLFGYIFCRLFPAHLNPLFGFIFINGSTLLYINRKYMRDGFLPETEIIE